MANEAQIYVDGNFLVAKDITTRMQYFKLELDQIRPNRTFDDKFYFTYKAAIANNSVENNRAIQGSIDSEGRSIFPFTDIVDINGNPYASADAFDTYLNENLGNFDLDGIEVITIPVPSAQDAFGRLRVSQQETQYYSKQLYDKLPLFVDEVLGNGGTAVHSIPNAETTLATVASGDYAIMQTKQRSNYQSSKSQLIYLTMSNFQIEANVEKRMGYFSSSTVAPYNTSFDGIMLENDGTDIRLRIYRTGTLVHDFAQSAWNDPLDGTGASGVTVDWEKIQIFSIDFQWLGAGKIRFYVVVDGTPIIFHTIFNANLEDNVYMSSPNQPLRWEIRQTGVGSGTFNLICSSANSEGPDNRTGKILSENLGGTSVNAVSQASKYALIAIRLQATKVDALIDVVDFSVLSTSADDQLVEVWINPTVSGTFTYNAVPNSAIAVAKGITANTNTVTGGTRLFSNYLNQRDSTKFTLENALKIGSNIDGTTDTLVVTTQSLSNQANVLAGINWRELI